MTTGIPHGPLSGADLPKLTGLSVLFDCMYSAPVSFSRIDRSLVEVVDRAGRGYASVSDRFAYLGEWSDDTRTVILAPEGGWRENPVPGKWVELIFRSGARMVCKSDAIMWPHSRCPNYEGDIVAFSLIEDAKPERRPMEDLGDGHWVDVGPEALAKSDAADRPAQALSDLAGMDGGDLAGKLTAIRDKFLIPTPDKDFTDYAIITRCIAALSTTPASPPAETGEGVGDYVREYEFRGDGGDYIPSEGERLLIEDAIHGYLATIRARPSDQSDTERMRAAAEALCAACEREFTSDGTEGGSFTYGEPDESEVAYPSSSITFGMIRELRAALGEA